jgi:steroid 5-alpha reductase family enzyme
MPIALVILIGWLIMAVVMAALWLAQRRTHNAGIVDVAWSFGTGLLGVWFAWSCEGDLGRRMLVGLLAALWGARLGGHLWRRMRSDKEEDGRYRMLREKWGPRTQPMLFGFFQIQAAWAAMFALPMLVAAANPTAGLRWHDWAGAAIWLIALTGEGIADAQLARFRADPAHHRGVCRVGLWSWSRHPNYFFEWLHWFAYVFIAIGSSWWFVTWLGMAIMLFFLLKVTGVPMTEARALVSRGEAYRAYQRQTSVFFPLPPRRL